MEEKLKHPKDHRAIVFNYGFSDHAATLFSAIRYLYHVDYADPTKDRHIIEFCLRTPPHVFCEP